MIKETVKETVKEVFIPILMCLGILGFGWGLSTESPIFFIGLPIFAYTVGGILGKLKNGKWNWKDGLRWGALAAAFSIATYLFGVLW